MTGTAQLKSSLEKNMTDSKTLSLFWPVFGALSAAFFALNTLPLTVGAVMDGLHVAEDQAGLLGSVELGTMAATILVMSVFVSRLPIRLVVYSACALLVLANLLSTRASSIEMLFGLRCMAGLAEGAMVALANAVAARAQEPEKLFARLELCGALLSAVLLSSLPYAIKFWSYSGVFMAGAAIVVLALPLLRNLPLDASDIDESIAVGSLVSRPVVLLLIGGFIFMGGQTIIWTFIERIGHSVGYSGEEVGTILALAGIVGMAGAGLTSIIGTRWGRAIPVSVGMLAMGLSAFGICQTGSKVMFTVLNLSMAAGFMFSWPFVAGLAADMDKKGTVVAALGGGSLIGVAIGPYLGGLIVAKSGSLELAGYVVLFTASTGLLLLMPAIRLMSKKTAEVGN